MRSRRIGRATALVIVAALAAATVAARQAPPDERSLTSGLESRVERFAPENQPPIELRFFLKPGAADQAERVVETTRSALQRLGEWLAPFPYSRLTIVDAPWGSPLVGASYPGLIVVSTRWLAPARDRALERTILGSMGRQYWFAPSTGDRPQGWFQEGLALYAGARAIHQALEGGNFETRRYFGGFIPFTIRSILLSPSPDDPRPRLRAFAELDTPSDAPWRFASAAPGGPAQRTALALHTLERYLGWPAFQQAISAFHARFAAGASSPADLSVVTSAQRGRDLGWFFSEALRFDATFDYAIESFTSEPSPQAPATFDTVLSLRRIGDAVFAGTSDSRDPAFAGARSLPVLVTFEDGREIRDWWDGRDAELRLSYTSPSRAVLASVDPDAVLLLDANRNNNTRTLRPALRVTGTRLALNWFVWLQDVMLTYTALL